MNKKSWIVKRSQLALLVVAGLLTVQHAGAVGLSISGTLISAPKCTMAEGPIVIEFGNVDVAKLSWGVTRSVEYKPVCTNIGNAGSYSVRLTFTGIESSIDSQYLRTDNTNLAIGMLDADNKVYKLNTPIVVNDLNKWPVLTVKLFQRPSSVLSEGKFAAAGSLVIDIM